MQYMLLLANTSFELMLNCGQTLEAAQENDLHCLIFR